MSAKDKVFEVKVYLVNTMIKYLMQNDHRDKLAVSIHFLVRKHNFWEIYNKYILFDKIMILDFLNCLFFV